MRAARITSLAVAASALFAAPAAAAPSLKLDLPCYFPDAPMTTVGAGFSASGPVDFAWSRAGGADMIGTNEDVADAAGAFTVPFKAPDLSDNARRETVTVVATDRNTGAAAPPVQFTLTAIDVSVPQWDRKRRVRAITVKAIGWVFHRNRPFYAHFVRGRKNRKTVRIGKLTGPCGDLTKKITLPSLPDGRYSVRFNASKKFREPAVVYTVTKG